MSLAVLNASGFTLAYHTKHVGASCNACFAKTSFTKPISVAALNGFLEEHRGECSSQSKEAKCQQA